MLDYRINTFLSVCKFLSYTKAADEQGITQPAVSQHIKYLEDMYNTKLFEFKGKKMRITKEGMLLMNAATTMLHDSIHLKEALSLIKEKNKKLAFGVTLTVGEYIIPKHIQKIVEKYGANDINIKVANTDELLKEINDGSVDFALVEGHFENNEYDYITYSKEPYIAVANKELNINSFEELKNFTLILREEGSGTRAICENILAANNIKIDDFKGKLIINNIAAIKKFVMQGMGISFMYKIAAYDEIESGELAEIKIKGFSLEHNFSLIWRKNSIYADYYKGLFKILSE